MVKGGQAAAAARAAQGTQCRGCAAVALLMSAACLTVLCLHSANTMRVYANARLDLLLAAGTEGAARKGHFRVRAFGGVVVYPVIKQRVCAPCDVARVARSSRVHKN